MWRVIYVLFLTINLISSSIASPSDLDFTEESQPFKKRRIDHQDVNKIDEFLQRFSSDILSYIIAFTPEHFKKLNRQYYFWACGFSSEANQFEGIQHTPSFKPLINNLTLTPSTNYSKYTVDTIPCRLFYHFLTRIEFKFNIYHYVTPGVYKTTLNIDQKFLSGKNLTYLLKYLANTQVHSLGLSIYLIRPNNAEQINANPNLKKLILYYPSFKGLYDIETQNEEEFLQNLSQNRYLKSLTLVDSQAASKTTDILLDIPTLINFRSNHNVSEKTTFLEKALRHEKLKKLGLCHYNFNFQAVNLLSQAVHLTHVDLSNTIIMTDPLINMIQNIPLEYLGLRLHNRSKNLIENKILQTLAEKNTLTHLDLSENNISETGFYELFKSKSLQKLVLADLDITSNQIPKFADCPTITSLDLSNNNINNSGFAKVLKISSLKNLNVSNNEITSNGLRGLPNNTTL